MSFLSTLLGKNITLIRYRRRWRLQVLSSTDTFEVKKKNKKTCQFSGEYKCCRR